ncbi:hypothetical protein BDV12DRAFT_182174 [Aspergillus spectabilis]
MDKTYHSSFARTLGPTPQIELCLENKAYLFAHEAGVYIPSINSIFITSNRLEAENGEQQVQISRIELQEQIHPNIPMANGAGTPTLPSSLIFREPHPPYNTMIILDGFHSRRFNSINDVVAHSDDSIWFTDPIYGYEQGIRPKPELPSQVYRLDPSTGSFRVMADGFGRPNGVSFSNDERTIYFTDTDAVHGVGSIQLSRASTIYAFDIKYYANEPLLISRRVFAMADVGFPDGIKCDMQGNVYSGCGNGLNVWSPGGVLIGKILIPGGVSNFCFARPGRF